MAARRTSNACGSQAVETVFAALPGHWKIARLITDLNAEFTGHADIRPINDAALSYREEGETRLTTGQTFKSNRLFLFKKEPEVLSVYFGDGLSQSKIFLRLKFNRSTKSAWPLRARDDHQCNCDLHKAEYEFISQDEFKVAYDVKGPETGYIVQTTYTRLQRTAR